MKDERIIAINGQIRQTVFWMISVLALLSLGIKLALSYIEMHVEIVFLAFMILNLVGRAWIRNQDRIVDESIQRKRGIVTSRIFLIAILSCVSLYFIQLPFLGVNHVLPANIFVSLALFTGVLSYFLLARKNQIYINAEIIDLSWKDYHIKLWKRIGILFLFALVIGVVSGGIYYLLHSFDEVIIITLLALFLSFISVSLEYSLLSIYEKLHSDEMFERVEGVYRYIPRTYVLISCLVLVFYFFKVLMSTLNQLYFLGVLGEYFYTLFQDIMILYDIVYGIPVHILAFLGFVILYRSQLKQPTEKPVYFPVFIVFAVSSMIYGIGYGLFQQVLYFVVRFGNPANATQLLTISSTLSTYLAMMVSILTLLHGILVYTYMKKNQFPASKLYIGIIILSFLGFWLTRIIHMVWSPNIQTHMWISLVSMIMIYVVSNVLHLLFVLILSSRKRRFPLERS